MTAVDYQVGDGANDGVWVGSNFYNAYTSYRLGNYSYGATKIFNLFTGVTIPDGATINSSYLSFYYNGNYGDAPPEYATLYADKQLNPSVVSSASDGNSRKLTTASLQITSPYASAGWWNTGDIKKIITELLALGSFASGNNVQFIIVDQTTNNHYANQNTYDAGASYGCKLHIEYTEAAAGNPHYAYAQQ